MGTLFLEEKKCFHCGVEGTFPKNNHAVTIVGPKDLDGRPSHIQRSVVYSWIQRCHGCGYGLRSRKPDKLKGSLRLIAKNCPNQV